MDRLPFEPDFEYRFSGVLDDGTIVGAYVISNDRTLAFHRAIECISREQCVKGNYIKKLEIINVSIKG